MQFVLTVVFLFLEAITKDKSGECPVHPSPPRAVLVSSIFIFLPEALLPFQTGVRLGE